MIWSLLMADEQHWVTVADAAVLAERSPRTIYVWIEKGLLATRTNQAGVTLVLWKAATRTGQTLKRGRPRGTPTRR